MSTEKRFDFRLNDYIQLQDKAFEQYCSDDLSWDADYSSVVVTSFLVPLY